jgi:type IV pilus assembly protein PilB
MESPHTSNTHAATNKRDCRISTCPTMFGEKIVVRILNSTHANLNVAQLGMNITQQKIFLQHIQATQGMILVTGPTGSGKTVTLYTALNLLNTIEHNILTVEDPIEIDLPGINQVEVNHKIGLSFALALRTFLRQDPDIIMVGEIRDLETAQIAIKAAQTGHLVLSTLHTNSAAASIMRLINMEVATYNLASSLNLLIAQRLIRTLCPHCKQITKLPENILQQQKINSSCDKSIFQANHAGCNKCKNGYAGRIGIFELLPISPQISSMILTKQSQTEIEQQAIQEGMLNLRTKAWHKVLNGITSISEINRVIL